MSNQLFRSLIAVVLGNLKRSIHTHRTLYGTHYETLKLPRNCTTKDVRDSFINLSKQYHPDKNQNDSSKHSQFVKLNEAYHVLSRPDKRREYDLSLKPFSTGKSHNPRQPFSVYTTENPERVVWRGESFWEYQDKTKYKDYGRTEDYYGIRGVRRLPNGLIALLCIILSAVGVFVQIALIRESNTFNRRKLDERSQEASRLLAIAQEKAAKYGNKLQVERIRESIKASQTNGFYRKERVQGKKPEDKTDIDSDPRPLVCSHVVLEPSHVLPDKDGEMLDYSTSPGSCRRNV